MNVSTRAVLWLAVLVFCGCQSNTSKEFGNSKEAVDLFRQAENLVYSGRYKEALPLYDEALQKEREYHTCRFRYAQVLVGIGRIYTLDADDFLSAAKEMREGEQKNLDEARLYEERAETLRREAGPYYKDALAQLNILKGVWPHNAGVYQHLALVYVYYDQLESAKAAFEQTLELEGAGSPASENLMRAIEIINQEMSRRNMAGR